MLHHRCRGARVRRRGARPACSAAGRWLRRRLERQGRLPQHPTLPTPHPGVVRHEVRSRAVQHADEAEQADDRIEPVLARRVRVAEVAPSFDGALLDNIVDYLTYVFAPVVLLWTAGYLPDGRLGAVVAAVPLLASCYQFCRTDAKTADHLFLGFPSYWNVVAFYLVVLDASVAVSTSVLLVLAALVFAP